MMVTNRGSVLGLLAWQWQHVLSFIALSGLAVSANQLLHWHPTLPTAPAAVVGAALGIFVSFRTNQAYARWWEGRQLWGRLVNVSRHFSAEVVAAIGAEAASPIVRRHIAYVHALRCALRDEDWKEDAALRPFLDVALEGERNVPAAILRTQYVAVNALMKENRINGFQLSSMLASLLALQDAQGGSERIKRTPMPRGYGFIAERLMAAYALLFPLAIAETGWWAIPISVLVCLCFALISEAGRVLEDPFNTFFNGLPLAALSKTIEINLRQLLGEANVEPLPKPDARGILL